MVDYNQVYEAFVVFAADRSQDSWCDLWILCQRRIEALIKHHLKGKPPIEDIDGLISDAVLKALENMKNADSITVDLVSEICWKAAMHTITAYFASLKRWRRMDNMASVLNSAKHF